MIKELLLVAAVVPFFYAFMSMLQGRWLGFNGGYMLLIGLIGFGWGLLMLTLFRVIGQEYQRRALVQQMAAVILPHQEAAVRERVIEKILAALLEMDERRRRAYLKAMNEGLVSASDEARAVMTAVMVAQLATLPEAERAPLMRAQAAALGEMQQEARVMRMGDMMSAVSALPDEQRRLMMEGMTALLA